MQLLIVFVLSAVLVILAVLIHYETLYLLASRLPRWRIRPRSKVLVGVVAILLAHVAEIGLFALGYLALPGMAGALTGGAGGASLLESLYFSFVTFTTVGYGDIVATGHLRFLAGLEALTGFVLITWSASFLFLEMQKYWPGLETGRPQR